MTFACPNLLRRSPALLFPGGFVLGALPVLLWLFLLSGREIDGELHSKGRMQLSSGQTIEVDHQIRITAGRFHALIRQGTVLLESDGEVVAGLAGRYLVRTRAGEITGLPAVPDNALWLNLFHARKKDSLIHITPQQDCLHAVEINRLYCP